MRALCEALVLDATRRAFAAVELLAVLHVDIKCDVHLSAVERLEAADPTELPFIGVHMVDPQGGFQVAVLSSCLSTPAMFQALADKARALVHAQAQSEADEREPWETDPDAWRFN